MLRNAGFLFVVGVVGALAVSPRSHAQDVFNVPPGETKTVGAAIGNGEGNNSVDVTGGGTVVLTNDTNSYSGGTTVADGSTLRVTADGNLGAASGVVILGDSTKSGTLDVSGSTGAVTTSREFILEAGGGTIVTGVNAWTLNGVVTGAGSLTIDGGGTLILNRANRYTGGTDIIGGSTLKIDSNTELGLNRGAVTLGNATSSGTLDISTAVTAATVTRDIVLGRGGGTIVSGAEIWTLLDVISGAGALTVSGAGGTLSLAGTNTYSGGTNVSGGATLEVANNVNFGAAGTAITLGNGKTSGTLEFTTNATAAAADTPVISGRGLTIDAGGGTINTQSFTWTFAGKVSGTGPLTVVGSGGSLILDGTGTYSGTATVYEGGILQIGAAPPTATTTTILPTTPAVFGGNVTVGNTGTLDGFATIKGTVKDWSGTVMAGTATTAGTLTVGNFIEDPKGTLSLLITPTTSSELIVLGKAGLLGGTLKLNFEGNFRSTTIDLIDAGSLTGKFATEIGTLSQGIQQSIVYLPDGTVELVLTQLKSLPQNPTLYTALISEGIDEAQAGNEAILTRMDNILNDASLDDMRTAETYDHAAGYGPGKTPYGAWATGLGGFGSTAAEGSAPGYKVVGGGFITGLDYEFLPGFFGGAAVSSTYSSVSENVGGASGDILTPRAMLYGGWWHGILALEGTLGFGDAFIDASRPALTGGTVSTANYSAYEVTAAFQASTNFRVGPVVFTPSLGFKYAMLTEPQVAETGGPYAVNVQGDTTESLRPFAALTTSTRFYPGDGNLAIEPRLRFGFDSEVLSNSRQITVQPIGDAADFLIQGVDPSRNLFNASAGVTVETSRDFGVYSDIGYIYGRNTNAAAMDAGVRYRF
jgi:fibronectin-binding autotransporter adhesin